LRQTFNICGPPPSPPPPPLRFFPLLPSSPPPETACFLAFALSLHRFFPPPLSNEGWPLRGLLLRWCFSPYKASCFYPSFRSHPRLCRLHFQTFSFPLHRFFFNKSFLFLFHTNSPSLSSKTTQVFSVLLPPYVFPLLTF